MAALGWMKCLGRGIWGRRPWNPLGKQAVWYDHEFEKVNERESYGVAWFDARCKRCGFVEKGWRDATPEPDKNRPNEARRPSGVR